MIPLRVTLSGFLSYQAEQTFDFSDHALWMLSGKNGAGKSSVFDAITFTLYGQHRGGSQRAGELINRQCDRLQVAFEFQISGEKYRAERTVPRKGAATRLLSKWENGEWHPLPGTSSDDGFETERKRAVGMEYGTFTSSVLLRQGKGDRFLELGNAERFQLLSQVVDLSQYQRLYEKANHERTRFKGIADATKNRLDTLPPTTDEQIKAAEANVADAVKAVDEADKRVKDSLVCLGRAPEWERLNASVESLKKKIAEADKLIANEADVIKDAARHEDLKTAIPSLRALRDAKEQYQDALKAYHAVCKEADALLTVHAPRYEAFDPNLTLPKQVKWLTEQFEGEIETLRDAERAKPYLETLAQKRDAALTVQREIDKLKQQLNGVIGLLEPAQQHRDAKARLRDAAQTNVNDANAQHTTAKNTLNDVAGRLERLEKAAQGDGKAARCFYCEQELTREQYDELHDQLVRERNEAGKKEQEASEHLETCKNALEAAKAALGAADTDLNNITSNITQIRNEISTQEQLLKRDCADARKAAQEISDGPYKQQAGALFLDGNPWPTADAFPNQAVLTDVIAKGKLLPTRLKEQTTLTGVGTRLTTTGNTLTFRKEALTKATEPVTEEWRTWLAEKPLELDPILALDKELIALKDAPQNLIGLNDAKRDRDHWKKDLMRDEELIEQIPEGARRPKAEVEADLELAQTALRKANNDLSQAQATLEDLRHKKAIYDEQVQIRDENRRQEGLYGTLADLLGREGLQRELLREAEDAVTESANRALSEFSHGTLRLEPRPDGQGSRGVDSALDLLCVNSEAAGDNAPLPLTNLSGSQRFRVAVALALGMGRFACRNGARIESVIIDEGFGSLDQENQQDMAEAIRALADGQSLKRIIVVSHQEAFADGFPNRKHIALGESGSRIVEQPVL